jgi:hypothetical protein
VCSALRRVNRRVNGTGSFASFRGINATGTSGLGAVFSATAVEGGDIARVADWGRVVVVLLALLEIGVAVLALAWPTSLLAACTFALGIIDPTKTDFGAASVEIAGATGSFVPSLSFSLLTSGSRSVSATFAIGGERMTSGFGTSWLKMQFGRSHLPDAADGHGTLPKTLKAGLEGHMVLREARFTC